MKAPKILPWIARKTGISDELAIKLWRRAEREAELAVSGCNSSDYYRWAVERFIDSAEAEGGGMVVRDSRRAKICLRWLWRFENRVSAMNLISAQCLAQLWHTQWNEFFFRTHRPAV